MGKLKGRIRDWYLGKQVRFTAKDGLVTSGHIDRPWLAIAFDYVCREYKWFIGVLIALFMAFLAYRRR